MLFRFLIPSLLCILTLTGCLSYDTTPPTVTQRPAATLDVGSIEVYGLKEVDYASLLTPSADELAVTWLKVRLQPTYHTNKRMVIDVDEAYTRKEPHASQKAFDAYTTQLALSFKLYDANDHLAQQTGRVVIKLTREMEKDASKPVRDTFFANMGKDLVKAMDTKIPAQLQRHFSNTVQLPDTQPYY